MSAKTPGPVVGLNLATRWRPPKLIDSCLDHNLVLVVFVGYSGDAVG